MPWPIEYVLAGLVVLVVGIALGMLAGPWLKQWLAAAFRSYGVYLVVVGLVLDILRTLGAEIDRHMDAAGPDAVAEDPAEVRA